MNEMDQPDDVGPHSTDVSAADRDRLLAVTADNLAVTVHDTFYDDHCPCIDATVNGVRVSFWWLTPEAAGAFYYSNSEKAKETILQVITEGLEDWEGPEEDAD